MAEQMTIAEVRKKFPQYDKVSDGQLADALYHKYYSYMPRLQFYAKIGYDPYSLKQLPHDLGQLAAGALPKAVSDTLKIPAPSSPEDTQNRTSGGEMLMGLGRGPAGGQSMLTPPSLRGGSWQNFPPAQASANPISPNITGPIASTLSSPLVKGMGALGAGGAGVYGLLKRLGVIP
jgi:hypothetical protein